MTSAPRNTILLGDALAVLRELPTSSVDTVITSPPYFQLRDYGVSGQLGLEPNIAGWVAGLRPVFREAARVLTPTASLWLNLGDSFSRHQSLGAPTKSLLLAPERLLLALAADGWLVRNKVVWSKSNPMPTSVTDRLALTYEIVYFLVRSPRYFFDLDAIREPHGSAARRRTPSAPTERPAWLGPLAGSRNGLRQADITGHPLGKNPGDVWRIATRGFPGAHFATFPPELVRRPILATCPRAVCTACRKAVTTPPCRCDAPTRPGLVLDPFAGTATVGVVARELGRDWLGVELNADYVRLAEARLGAMPVATTPGAAGELAA